MDLKFPIPETSYSDAKSIGIGLCVGCCFWRKEAMGDRECIQERKQEQY